MTKDKQLDASGYPMGATGASVNDDDIIDIDLDDTVFDAAEHGKKEDTTADATHAAVAMTSAAVVTVASESGKSEQMETEEGETESIAGVRPRGMQGLRQQAKKAYDAAKKWRAQREADKKTKYGEYAYVAEKWMILGWLEHRLSAHTHSLACAPPN